VAHDGRLVYYFLSPTPGRMRLPRHHWQACQKLPNYPASVARQYSVVHFSHTTEYFAHNFSERKETILVRVLTNEDIGAVLDYPHAIDALYDALRAFAGGTAARRPRVDVLTPAAGDGEYARFTTADGVVRGGYYALRVKPEVIGWPEVDGVRRLSAYYGEPGHYGGFVMLCRTDNARLVAIIQDRHLQYVRTAALAGLGARYLARPESATLGMLGAGGYARSYARALATVLPLTRIKVYCPTPEHVEAYCAELRADGLPAQPASDPQDALAGADVVSTCTNSLRPVLFGAHLRPGMFVCNVSNRELDASARERITTVGHLAEQPRPLDLGGYQDGNFAIHLNTMSYVAGTEQERAGIPRGGGAGASFPGTDVSCVDWKTGRPLGRTSDEEITFLSDLAGGGAQGLSSGGLQGVELAGLAGRAYELAVTAGLGTELPDELFLQKD
jgi:alanine dehydrogenase